MKLELVCFRRKSVLRRMSSMLKDFLFSSLIWKLYSQPDGKFGSIYDSVSDPFHDDMDPDSQADLDNFI